MLMPLQLCKNPNMKIDEAIILTGASLKYQAIWQRVTRRRKKEEAAGKSTPSTIDVASKTSPISDIAIPPQ
jgi:hypothetical protein